MTKNIRDISDHLSITDKVYKNIKLDILKGYSKPGTRLTESNLSKIMNVSQAPIREALKKLQKDGFVNIIPRKGTIVAKITIEDIEDTFETREIIEPLVLIKSIKNIKLEELEKFEKGFQSFINAEINEKNKEEFSIIDRKFHKLFMKNCDNKKIIELLGVLYEKIYWFRSFYEFIHSFNDTVCDHLNIIEAIKKKDAFLILKELTKHIRKTKNNLISELKLENITEHFTYSRNNEQGILEIIYEIIERDK